MAGLGAYAYNVENTVLGSRGLDDWACEFPRWPNSERCMLCLESMATGVCAAAPDRGVCVSDFNQTKPMQRDAFTPFH